MESPIFANQVECQPMLHQGDLLADAREHDYWLVAYSPLARGKFFDHPVLVEVAEKHDATPAQVCLAWLLARENVAAIPKATGDRVTENLGACDVDLDESDVARIHAIEDEHRVVGFDAAPWHTDD